MLQVESSHEFGSAPLPPGVPGGTVSDRSG
jgi:hypothetical protein